MCRHQLPRCTPSCCGRLRGNFFKQRRAKGKRAIDLIELFSCASLLQNEPMIYGYARVSTDGQSEAAQVRQLHVAGAKKVFREVASGAKTDRPQLRRLLAEIGPGDVVMVTRLDRLARSTRDLLNTLAAMTVKKAGFRSLADVGRYDYRARAFDADRPRRAGGVRARIDPRSHRRRPGAGQGARAELGPTLQAHPASAGRGDSPPRPGRTAQRHRSQLQRPPEHDFSIDDIK
jgi:hypothetical protein